MISKITAIGDIHGRTVWKSIVEEEKDSDVIVFLGDYVSTHDSISSEQQIENLKEILEYKKKNADKVILLRGNHDVQHLMKDYSTSGFDSKVGTYMSDNIEDFMSNTQWVYECGDIVFSHAGISQTWYENNSYKSISEINDDDNLDHFVFTPSKMSDYYGDSPTQPLTWIRPNALMSNGMPGKTYVVGHTPTRNGHIFEYYGTICEKFPDLAGDFTRNIKVWLCDALPDEYLVIENNDFTVKKKLQAKAFRYGKRMAKNC